MTIPTPVLILAIWLLISVLIVVALTPPEMKRRSK
jgi:hypothetical protein